MSSAESVGHGPRAGAGLSDRAAGWAVGVVGVLLVGVGAVHGLTADVAAFEVAVASLPGVTTVLAWLGVWYVGVDESFYPRLLGWAVVGGGVLGGLVLAVVLVRGGGLLRAVPLVQFTTGMGTTTGLLIGANETRSVRAARAAERARVQAALATEERERLQFLNHLLRHNVLNKVNVVQAYADAAREKTGAVDPEIDTIEAQTEDIVEVVENVRVLVESTTNDHDRRPIDVRDALLDEADSLRQATDAEVTTDLDDDLVVAADPLVRYVFANLLRNAVEHNDAADPAVHVGADRGEATVRVAVADNGPGISDQNKEAVFQPAEAGNHGLGLYLVRTLVADYGGEVRVRDNEPRGTVFEVELPRADH